MADPKSRSYLRWVIGLFLLAIGITVVVTTTRYWTDKREPVGLSDDAR